MKNQFRRVSIRWMTLFAVGGASLSSCIFSHPVVCVKNTRWSVAGSGASFDFQGLQDSYGANELTDGGVGYYCFQVVWVHEAGVTFRVYLKATHEYIGGADYEIGDRKTYAGKPYSASMVLSGKNETGVAAFDLDGKTLYRYAFPDSERDARFAYYLHWKAQGAEFYTQNCDVDGKGVIEKAINNDLHLDHYLGKLDYLGGEIVFRMAFLGGGRYEAIRHEGGKDGETLFSGSYTTAADAMEASVESSPLPSFPYSSFRFAADVETV